MRIHKLEIEPSAPGAVDGADSIGVPCNPPIVRGLVVEVGEASSKSVLWSDAAYGVMHGFPSEEFLGTRKNLESSTAFFQLVHFASGVNFRRSGRRLRRILLSQD